MPPSTFGIDLPLLVPVLGLVFSNPRFSKLLGFSGARVRLLGMWLSRVRVGLGLGCSSSYLVTSLVHMLINSCGEMLMDL